MSRLGVSGAFVFQNAAVANGNGNTMSVDGYTTILISVVSSVGMSGGTTVNFEASTDGTNWTALSGEKIGASPASAATTTADGDFRFNVAGYRKVRCRISAYSAGTTTITGHATMATANAGQPVQVVGGTSQVTGNVASGSVDSGNPVKVGGVVSTTIPAGQTTGKRVDVWFGNSGQVIMGGAPPSINDGLPQGPAVIADANGALRALAALGFVFNGATNDRLRTPTVFKPLASTAIGTETTIWTPAGGKKFRLMGFTISTSAAVSIVLKDNTSGTTIYQIPKLLVDTPLVVVLSGNGILSAAANNVLTATSSAAANLIGTFFGTEE